MPDGLALNATGTAAGICIDDGADEITAAVTQENAAPVVIVP